ncbi:uncharacterized protein LOC133744439 [Rosa rugosa]|uniref:uncharacterized protein LOC133744439 n=1 Tax=Rosa rugosa TaxID=74645 RepID=UPI002B4101A9|nr:uncharacterized protein LOC133744439 [Rosa rugosa]
MRGFREALGYGDLLDLGFQGTKTTWWNYETKLRLDRAICTPSWFDIFGYAKVIHLPPSDSDHIPILLCASMVPIPKWTRFHRFKFEAFWLQQPECDSMVRQQSMLGVRARLEELMDVQMTEDVQVEKQSLMGRLPTLLSQEESFLKQKFKVQWLKEGDRNTSFFHRKAVNRKRKNLIQGLFDEDGNWCEDDADVERIVSSYFTKMFTASELDFGAMESLEAIQPCVSQ